MPGGIIKETIAGNGKVARSWNQTDYTTPYEERDMKTEVLELQKMTTIQWGIRRRCRETPSEGNLKTYLNSCRREEFQDHESRLAIGGSSLRRLGLLLDVEKIGVQGKLVMI
ncbi:hypothetical protein R1flu_016714 [Riccia fluitans]|uniref:Uncharacterized protein n=1 Tax=Riccia fluitans TaxID=41844 RepID=A0ABD1YMM5_9MARC